MRFAYVEVAPEDVALVDLQTVRDWAQLLSETASREGWTPGPLANRRTVDGWVVFIRREKPAIIALGLGWHEPNEVVG